MRTTVLLMLLLVMSFNATGQNVTVSGNTLDAATGEHLVGVVVKVKGNPMYGTTSNEYGYYSLTMPAGIYELTYSYVGFNLQERILTLKVDTKVDVQLTAVGKGLNEVTVNARRSDNNITSVSMGVERLDIRKAEQIPVLFGEKDIVKVIQMTPGVKAAGEGNAGFYVRGGGADQNLVLVDEAPVYNASHLMGFFSVFNSDALKDVTLYKGSIPAQYGGRLSSVLDVRMRDGNNKRFAASGGLGTISSRLTLEGPLKKDRGAFIVSGRRSYADLFLKLSKDDKLRKSALYFYDLNLKVNYQIDEKNRLYMSGYFGRDVFAYNNTFGNDWGNATATLRWNHIFGPRLFSNTSAIVSNYSYKINAGKGEDEAKALMGIRDINLKHDLTFAASNKNSIKAGLNIIHHSFLPGEIIAASKSNYNSLALSEKRALEGAAYVQDEVQLNNSITVQAGIRYSLYQAYAKGKVYEYALDGSSYLLSDVNGWRSIQYYGGFEPRASMRWSLNSQSSVKAGFNRGYQYLHLLSNASTSSPMDQWISSSNNVKPQVGNQFSVGYFRNAYNNMFEMSVETYFKSLNNQIDYRPAAELIFNETVEGELVYGKGSAYGAELSIKKEAGKLTGWVSYTFSRSLRRFDGIDNGKVYPAKQDRIHDIAIVALYDVSSKLKLSANWIYYTGNAATFPSGRYSIAGVQVPYYTERNGYRMPDYHRLDLGLTWIRKKTDRFESSWNFSLYNAYGRENAYTISFRQSEEDASQTEAVQTTLFRWIPSITYNFKF